MFQQMVTQLFQLQPIKNKYCTQLQPIKIENCKQLSQTKLIIVHCYNQSKLNIFKQHTVIPKKTKYCTQLKQNILHREMSKNIILIYLQNYNIIYYLYKFYFVCPVAVMNYITNLVPDGEAMLSSQVMDGRPLVDLHQEQVQVVVVL